MSHVVSAEEVERTIRAFTRLDQRGDKKAMHKLALRLQKEQPHLLQRAAQLKSAHGDVVGEAAVFYATLVWAMFDRGRDGTLPRLTAQNLADAEAVVTEALATVEGLAGRPAHEQIAPQLAETQPEIYAKLAALLAEDVQEAAMTAETAAIIIKPTEVVIEAFDAALSGRRAGERQGTIVADAKIGRNEPCPCGSGKKYKKCHGEVA
ncbi:MAG TPA: SEC-C metal-binding domain-containing protein [Kofleriaceae bacterium]|nr:SEC-C metal-binding domain-containing protein [Kofleriaceae bacterium]